MAELLHAQRVAGSQTLADDAALAEERVDRVYDTYASEEEFIGNDNWIAAFATTLEKRPYTSREFLYLLLTLTP